MRSYPTPAHSFVNCSLGSHILSSSVKHRKVTTASPVPLPSTAQTASLCSECQGCRQDSFEPGMEFRSRFTILAESTHLSQVKEAIHCFKLRERWDLQMHSLLIGEIRCVNPSKHEPGKVVHFMCVLHGGWTCHSRSPRRP